MDALNKDDGPGREVYDTLRELARAWLRRERPGHTLQPTALVHEAYLRLAESGVMDAGGTPATPRGSDEANPARREPNDAGEEGEGGRDTRPGSHPHAGEGARAHAGEGGDVPAIDDRARFQALAANVMRRVLVDHARRRGRQRRGGGWRRVDGSELAAAGDGVDVLALDDALAQLASEDARAARVVELRFFGGLSVEHTAALLGVSSRTVELDWRFARARLLHALSEDAS